MEITNISNLDSSQFTNQDYTSQDEGLLNSLIINQEFGLPEDKVEVHIISPNGELLDSIYDFRNYTTRQTDKGTSLYSSIELDPKKDLESFGYFTGQYDINYFFYRQLFNSSEANKFFISEISSDRTEIKISSNNISYNDLGRSYLNFITIRNSRAFYTDFLLNNGDNKTYIGVNIALDNINTSLPSLYIKLYEPLPSNFKLKDTFWLVENISEPYSFRVDTKFIAENLPTSIPLRGPNINIELAEKTNLTTNYLNLSNLLSTSTTSSYQQLKSWMEEKSIELTIDYNDFNNFIHFSSAGERIKNFEYKLQQIQALESDINSLTNLNPITSQGYINVNINNIQSKIDLIIEKFDGYEYFLYYESGSNSWPKTNSEKPYINNSTTSTASKTWLGSTNETSQYYGGKLLEADNYDILNRDYIWNNLPEYIKEDSQNSNLELFIAMMGQHYDNIWTYTKEITDLQVADNRIDFGISKDLVADTLRNFGIKLYTNSRGQDDLYMALLGIDANVGTLHSTGSYQIDTYVTASQYTISDNNIVKETYKRIYHNLPYLLKTKGTKRGLYSLINCFGIPETILKIKEYGGNKKDQNIIEQFNEKFNYSLENPNLSIPFESSNKQYLDTGNIIYPDTLEFRFKLNEVYPTQSLLSSYKNIRVIHTTGSYAQISFGLSNSASFIYSTPLELPLYNDGWWNLNLTRNTGSISVSQTGSDNTYTLTIGNKDSKKVQYLVSSSINIDGSTQSNYNKYGWNTSETIKFPLSGSIQEFRYWINSIPESNFEDHILNPQSIVYNGVTGSYNNLIYRLPLGSELDNSTDPILYSVHPSNTSSFNNGSTGSLNSGTYVINHEEFLVNTPNIGTITEIDEKLRIVEYNLIPGDVLSPFISIQKPEIYPYTPDLSIVEVAISPQDSINEDIISQLGSFNIDDYIGDPRLNSSDSYPALDELRDFYFKKYSSSQNIFDIIKLLSYFDNSLFKMIKDFVPARTNLSTGLVIKSHILERNKIARHEPVLEFIQYSGSIDTAFITGSNGLNLEANTTNVTITSYISGSIPKINNDKRELFTGELGGTIILAHSQSKDNIVYEANYLYLSGSQTLNTNYKRIALNPTLNNVYLPRLSSKYLDVDYSYSPIIPTNFNYLTASLFSNLSSSNYPFLKAPIQDSNYSLKRHITPRYLGSKLSGALYNAYSIGDTSYGKDPVINIHPIKFAYFKEITSQSATLNGRSNVNIKYLIDSASNITELTEANKNLFDVQETYNRTDVNIALDNINQPSKQKDLNGLKTIFAGGYRYEPLLINYSNTTSTHGSIKYNFNDGVEIINTNTSSLSIAEINNGVFIDRFELVTPINSTPINSPSDILNTNLNSEVRAIVRRKTPYDGELLQRVTGNITYTIKVSPLTGQTANVWNEIADGGGGPFEINIPLPRTITSQIPLTNGTTQYMWDLLGSIALPTGYTAYGEESNYGITTTVIGDNYQRKFFTIYDHGLDYLTVIANDTSASFQNYINQNSFGSPATLDKSPTIEYGIDSIDSLIINMIFPIEGLIQIPSGVGAYDTPTPINLKSLTGAFTTIAGYFDIIKKLNSPQIQFTTAPSINLTNISLNGKSYYYTQSPSKTVVTSSIDLGFNNGSSSDNNWYFERGNSVISGSEFTYLTASYKLSELYYNYLAKTDFAGVPFTQELTSSLIIPSGSYEQIATSFIPKKGDLIKFYNHNIYKFPYQSEYEREIIKIYPPLNLPIGTGSNGTGSYDNRLVFEVSKGSIPLQACQNYEILDDQTVGHILNFIFLSKIEDETNIIINHEKKPGQTSEGILFSTAISQNLKNEAGNIIKDLKSQNLI